MEKEQPENPADRRDFFFDPAAQFLIAHMDIVGLWQPSWTYYFMNLEDSSLEKESCIRAGFKLY